MSRLTKFVKGKYIADIFSTKKNNDGEKSIDLSKVEELIQKLGEYEELEEKGLLLKLPCVENTKVYEFVEECNALSCSKGNESFNNHCKKCRYYNPHFEKNIMSLSQIVLRLNDFGKTLFLKDEDETFCVGDFVIDMNDDHISYRKICEIVHIEDNGNIHIRDGLATTIIGKRTLSNVVKLPYDFAMIMKR